MSYMENKNRLMEAGFFTIPRVENEITPDMLPRRATYGSAGYDFLSPVDIVINPGEQQVIWSNVRCMLPVGYVLEIYPRSSYGIKKGIMLANTVGIIDSDYFDNPSNMGNIGICLKNMGKEPVEIKRRDAIAQGIIKQFYITCNDEPKNHDRTGGIGSTGK